MLRVQGIEVELLAEVEVEDTADVVVGLELEILVWVLDGEEDDDDTVDTELEEK